MTRWLLMGKPSSLRARLAPIPSRTRHPDDDPDPPESTARRRADRRAATIVGAGPVAFWASLLLSLAGLCLAGLVLPGLGISVFTHRQPIRSGARQLLLSLVAAVVTYGIGTLIGAAGI